MMQINYDYNVQDQRNYFFTIMTVWPSGLRRWLQAPVRKGVGSNPTAVILAIICASFGTSRARVF